MPPFSRSLLAILFLGSAGITKLVWSESTPVIQLAQSSHDHSTPTQKSSPNSSTTKSPAEHEKSSPQPPIKPAEGASVKILSPKQGQTVKGDQVPLQFKLVKGKRGHHVHAYVDNELMGMFEGEKGTLTGIQPGTHILKLRVVAEDHQTELNASDEVSFVIK